MEVHNFSTNRFFLSLSPVTLSCSHLVAVSSGVSWVSLLCYARLTCSRWASLLSGVSWVSLLCCVSLFCSRPAVLWSGVSDANRPLLWFKIRSRWTADHGLYPLLFNHTSLCWALPAVWRSLSPWFLHLSLSLLISSDSIIESFIQLFSDSTRTTCGNIASLINRAECSLYTEYTCTTHTHTHTHIYIQVTKRFLKENKHM